VQSKTEGTRFTRDNAVAYNQKLKQVSEEKLVHYLDVYTLLADSQGYLPDSFSAYDGIHILSAQYASLKSYLRTHTA
jgi:lysophospholipase L1-like esterase